MSANCEQDVLIKTRELSDTSMQAVGQIYKVHYRWLHSWIRGKLGSSDRADDFSQDTFERVIVSRQVNVIQEPRAFLKKIAHGIIVNFWRRQDLEYAYLDAIACVPEPLSPSPEERAIALETLSELDSMLDHLPEKVRRAFLLSQLEHKTYAEIAIQLGVSERMVKKYMAQAMLNCLTLSATQ